MDKLEHIFKLQAAFDDDLAKRRGLDFSDGPLWVQKEIMALLVESGELLAEVNYKWWKDSKPVDKQKVLEEMVDMLHFFVAAALRMGFSANDLYDGYLKKNKVNFDRQKGLFEAKGYKSPPPTQ